MRRRVVQAEAALSALLAAEVLPARLCFDWPVLDCRPVKALTDAAHRSAARYAHPAPEPQASALWARRRAGLPGTAHSSGQAALWAVAAIRPAAASLCPAARCD